MSANPVWMNSARPVAAGPSGEWVKVVALEELPLREGRVAVVGNQQLALFRLPDRVAVVENRCPHKHGPLADGIVSAVDGKVTVTCPLHTWRICLGSGRVAKPAGETACVKTYAAKVEQGIVLVQISAAAPPNQPGEEANWRS